MTTRRRGRGIQLLGLTAVVTLAVAACSGGGKQATEASSGGGGNAAGSSGYTIAMITHETPGDTFWDKIKAGAQQAAKDKGITLKYSNDPDADQAGHPDPERRRLQGRRHRHHAGHAGRARRRGEGRHRREDPGGRLQLRHRPVQAARRADVLRLRREPGRDDGRAADRASRAPSTRSA